MTVASFDELYAVSDLHLGGKPGFQIFNQGDTLAAFIRQLAQPSKRRVALVLNGDIVDFLAEEPAKYLDPNGAVDKLADIYQRPAFAEVWNALETFVAQKKRRLVLVLGNHDVELALPNVQEWLLDKLTQGHEERRGRVTMAYEGAGYACQVGDKRVLCVHGNEVDTWNVVDQHALLEVSRAVNRGNPPPEWDANAGTRMVIDIMNAVKKDFPMVDLLKPEAEAVVPVLMSLDPGRVREIGKILKVAGFLSRDKVRRSMGFLSAEQAVNQTQVSDEKVVADFLAEHFEYGSTADATANSLIADAFDAVDSGVDPKSDPAGGGSEFLGPFDYVSAIFGSSEKKADRLRQALRKNLEENHAFESDHKDATFEALDQEVGPEVDYLLAGHTHLERALERSHDGRYYFNSGTWIRLIRLTDEVLADETQFDRVYRAFQSSSIESLDKLDDLGSAADQPLVMSRPTVVAIVEANGSVYGELRHAQQDGTLLPLNNTRWPRS